MKTKQIFMTILILTVSFLGCKKEIIGPAGPQGPGGIGSADPRLFNKWEIISGKTAMKYLTITNENHAIQLYEDKQTGFKSYSDVVSLITGSQLNFAYATYNYSISNDTLRLMSTGEPLVAKRNDNAPTITNWVPVVSPYDSFKAPPIDDPREDIGSDGQHLYMSMGANSDSIYKVSIATKSLVGTIPFYGYYSSIEYAEDYLWATNSNTVRKLNKITGEELQVSPTIGDYTISGLAYDGQYFWCNGSGNRSDTIYKYDPINNSIVSKIPLTERAEFTGMAYANGHLYVCGGGFVHKCTTSPFKAVKTYKIETLESYGYGGTTGIAYDGSNFWIKAEKGYEADEGIWLYKVNLD